MPYLCDVRTASANNVIEVNNKLFIEGVEFTPTNLAPVAFSQGPTLWGVSNSSQACGQLCLSRTYVRGSMGSAPSSGVAGQFDSTKIACGQDIQGVGFVYSGAQGRYYGVAGANATGVLSSFDSDFRVLSAGTIVIGAVYSASSAFGGVLFLPPQNGRWIYVAATSYYAGINTLSSNVGTQAGVLTEAGVATNTLVNLSRFPAIPYIGTDWVVITGYGASSGFAQADAQNSIRAYALNRDTGAVTTMNLSWFASTAPPAIVSTYQDYFFSFPSNAIVETPGLSAYFYQPIMSADNLNVFIGNLGNLNTTPTIAPVTSTATITSPGGVDTTNDVVTTSVDVPNFSRVRFTTSSSLPAPLALATDYWTIRQTSNTSRIATSYANAVAGTYIDLTTTGAGTQTMTRFETLNLDTSQVTCLAGASNRNTRAWVFSDSGTNYLCIGLYEPGAGSTVTAASCSLYLWRLDSKTSATFLQKLEVGNSGRVRAFMPTDSTQKRILVVYDDKIVFYGWNPSTNWTFQSTQGLNTQDVGIDSQGRVWATDVGSYIPGTPTGFVSQNLYVYEPSGAAANITVSFEQTAYTFTGVAIASNIVLNAYDTLGNRVALSVTLTRDTTNFSFSGGAASTTVTTSTSGNTLVPISVFSTGQLSVLAVPT